MGIVDMDPKAKKELIADLQDFWTQKQKSFIIRASPDTYYTSLSVGEQIEASFQRPQAAEEQNSWEEERSESLETVVPRSLSGSATGWD